MRCRWLAAGTLFAALSLLSFSCSSTPHNDNGANSAPAQANQQPAPQPVPPGSADDKASDPPSISYAKNPEKFAKMPVYEPAFNITNPRTPQEHFNVAVNDDQHNQLDDAILEYKKALEMQPNWPVAHYRIAVDYQKKGRIDDAISEWEQTTHYDPQFYSAYDMLAGAYQHQGNLKKAIEAYSELLKNPPSRMPVHYQLGLWYEELGDRQHAESHLEAYRQLAATTDESKTDRYQKALRELRKLRQQS